MLTRLSLLSAGEAAKRLRVHPKTVSRLVRQGRLVGVKVANRWVIDEATCERFSQKYVGKRGRPTGRSSRKEGSK